nr:MAG TPA: hypothetical protein [Caudoviricetes sp.]
MTFASYLISILLIALIALVLTPIMRKLRCKGVLMIDDYSDYSRWNFKFYVDDKELKRKKYILIKVESTNHEKSQDKQAL